MLMEEKRIREVRDEKEIRFRGGGETVDADELVGKLDSKRVNNFNKNITGQNEDGDNKAISFIPDELSGPRDDGNEYVAVDNFYTSGTNENVEDREFGRDTNRLDYFRVTSFDVHGDQSLPGIASYGGGGGTRRVPRGIAGKVEGEGIRALHGDNKAISFIPDELSGPRDDGNEYVAVDSFYTSGTNENVEDREFGRDTNRLDYFRVTSFDVHGDQSLPGIASYGGGGGTRRVPRGIAGKVEGEGIRALRWWEKCWLKLTCRDSSM
ncbi:hypothetical protein L1887_35797 [Cichorium endivia]|nr:hypothetical protein L1887_35797 [Cichorium endivia]